MEYKEYAERAEEKEKKIEEIVETAKICLKIGRDNKAWIYPTELDVLLKAGARSIKQNSREKDGKYTQEVLYEGIVFQTATLDPIKY